MPDINDRVTILPSAVKRGVLPEYIGKQAFIVRTDKYYDWVLDCEGWFIGVSKEDIEVVA